MEENTEKLSLGGFEAILYKTAGVISKNPINNISKLFLNDKLTFIVVTKIGINMNNPCIREGEVANVKTNRRESNIIVNLFKFLLAKIIINVFNKMNEMYVFILKTQSVVSIPAKRDKNMIAAKNPIEDFLVIKDI